MKKPVVWTEHARFRMHLRQIPRAIVEKALAQPTVQVEDALTGNSVAVGEAFWGGKIRLFAVVYEETEQDIRVVTVHPIRRGQYRLRLQSGRWKAR